MVAPTSIPREFGELISATTPKIQSFCIDIFTLLVKKFKCLMDVREDYVTFSSLNGIVVAIYLKRAEVDVILALPIDKSNQNLFNAIDQGYKWRNLPVGICVNSLAKARIALDLARQAHKLVSSGVIQEQDGEAFSRPKAAFQPAFKKKLRYR